MLPMGRPERKLIDFALEIGKDGGHTFVSTNFDTQKALEVENHVKQNPNTTILRDKTSKIGAGSIIDHHIEITQFDQYGDMVILPADHVLEGFDLQKFKNFHRQHNADITILVTSPVDYGTYVHTKDSFATEIVGKIDAKSLSITGVYIIRNKFLFNWIRGELKNGWNKESRNLFQDLIAPTIIRGKAAVYQLPYNGYWDDAGTIYRYYHNNMRLSDDQNVISPTAKISPETFLRSSILIGSPVINQAVEWNKVIISGSGPVFNINFIEQ